MGKKIHDPAICLAVGLQAYLAPITREFGCLGVGKKVVDSASQGRDVFYEKRWAALRAELRLEKEVAKFVEELMDELREANAT